MVVPQPPVNSRVIALQEDEGDEGEEVADGEGRAEVEEEERKGVGIEYEGGRIGVVGGGGGGVSGGGGGGGGSGGDGNGGSGDGGGGVRRQQAARRRPFRFSLIGGVINAERRRQGLTLVHFSAQPGRF